MNYEESPERIRLTEKFQDNIQEPVSHSGFRKPRPNKRFQQDRLPFWLTAGALFMIVFLLALITLRIGRKTEPSNAAMLARIERVEETVRQLAQAPAQLKEMTDRMAKLESMENRFSRLESAVTLQLDMMDRKLVELKTELEKSKQTKKAAVPAKPPEKKSMKKASTAFHHVRAGETLYSIAKHYGLKVSRLKKINPGLTGNQIYPGQKIKVTAK